MKDAKVIPIKDVTESADNEEQVMADAKAKALDVLNSTGRFVLVSIAEDQQGAEVVAGCSDADILNAALTMASMVGAAQIGEALDKMPPQVANAVALTQGLGQLNAFARQVAADAGAHLNDTSH